MRIVPPLLAAALATAMLFVNGCAPAEEDSDESANNLTLTDGSKFVVSARSDRVVLKTTTGDCSGCSLLDTLVSDSKNKITSLDDLEGKSILIHPIDKKAEDGAFLRVKKIKKSSDRLTLEGDPVLLEEIGEIDEDDVVRIYMDRKIPTVKGAESGRTTGSAFANQLWPATFGLDTSARPATFGGILAGDAPTFVVWKGVRPQIDFLGIVTPYISDMSFRPEVRLAWQRGRGLEVGLQMDFEEESGITLKGILGGNTQIFKQSVETPDVTMLVPAALALPFKLTFSASFQCNAVAGGQMDLDYRHKIKVHAGGSAVINPAWDKPASEWVHQGQWPFAVDGTSEGNFKKFEAAPSVGIICMVRLSANFSPKWFPAGGLYVAIVPMMLLVNNATNVSTVPQPSYSVNLAAGAWTKGDLAVETNLLRWTP